MELSEVVHEICQYFNMRELLLAGMTNKLFNRVCTQKINDVENGKIDPDQYFNMSGFNMDDFNYPINSMLDNVGDWGINPKSSTKELSSVINMNNINKIYFYRVGECDGDSWIIVGKSDNYYFYFDASCDYTGFDCQGGGEFCYNENWTVLWNMYISDRDRKLLLDYYGYHTFKLS